MALQEGARSGPQAEEGRLGSQRRWLIKGIRPKLRPGGECTLGITPQHQGGFYAKVMRKKFTNGAGNRIVFKPKRSRILRLPKR